MTNFQNSDSININCVVLHPNTEQALIEERNNILKEKNTLKNKLSILSADFDFYPFFPLYGIFENNISLLTKLKIKAKDSSSKSEFRIKECFFKSYFFSENYLFFKAALIFENKKYCFYIPFAINKNSDSKNLSSVFLSASKIVNSKINSTNEIKLKNKITFKSFQIASLELTENQYRLFDNVWIKTNPDEIL